MNSRTERFDPNRVREELLSLGFDTGTIFRYLYRPFDVRWLFWHPKTKLLDEKRPEYVRHIFAGNFWLEARRSESRDGWDRGATTSCLADNFANGLSNFFPLFLRGAEGADASETQADLFSLSEPNGPRPNISEFARGYLADLGCTAKDLFFHIVAILHAPPYRKENVDALRQNWPRVPLPGAAEALLRGAFLGRQMVALLDPDTPVPGISDIRVRADLRGLGELTVQGETANKQCGESDLHIEARWGYAGQGGVVMPGPGKVGAGTRGEGFLDIYLNATTRWKDVPEAVWNYTLSGYQVLKKWLSYREAALLGRPLTADEAQEFTHHVRRIAAILALHPQLDDHYRAVCNAPYPSPGKSGFRERNVHTARPGGTP